MHQKRIHILHLVNGWGTDDVIDTDDVLVFEAQKDLDLSKCALAVRLVLKWADLLDGHTYFVVPVVGRTAATKGKKILWFIRQKTSV